MNLPEWVDTACDIAAAVCVLGAAVLAVAAGVGLLRFSDPLSRLHAATKPQILGLLLIISAVALSDRSLLTLFALVPTFIMQTLTAPVAAHMIGRAAYRAGHIDTEHLSVDELAPAVEQSDRH